ncbi:gliding motility lipoprotein GldD [Runella slithyformis]|uniref:Gliding motility-associated lipoprotein GldD n=1 Tax=Runella slithyformis (strain ATCC 29530 / DSM 19594 / LMG 11500 / NCIMB 11436 / LSU 4) TaxID=761193 RepID=A0A7U3ZLR0_RUNSL|nr:gliding motility lipoprotein GldD [Runella slithyformis]AEI49531.1 gliding motility-associated lipoprotein GldD [Runella slithyformis DSM 19594]
MCFNQVRFAVDNGEQKTENGERGVGKATKIEKGFIGTFFLYLLPLYLLVSSCNSATPDYVPKPKGYPRMDLPPQTYQLLKEDHPYSFEYSKSAVILPDTFRMAEPHWIFVAYPTLNASIQLTYKPVQNSLQRLSGFINDAYRLAGKHQVRATGMRERVIRTKSGQTAVVFDLSGDVPSYTQFFTTDSTAHYLRGALYFTVADKQDSLQPAIDYLKKDVMHLLNTLKWKK